MKEKRIMTRYRLHYFPESGNSYKLALMLTAEARPCRTGILPPASRRFPQNIECSPGTHAFAIGVRPTVADFSMMADLCYPQDETGYDLATSYPAVKVWLLRSAALPGWRAPYELLPGQRLVHSA